MLASNDGPYLLQVDLAGTGHYCDVDVSAALNRAIQIAARGGKRFERLILGEIFRRPTGTRFVQLQLTATRAEEARSCSIAATLSFARLEAVEMDGQALRRTIHSPPGTTFIEPQHTGDEAALAEELVTYLLVIDEIATSEDYAYQHP